MRQLGAPVGGSVRQTIIDLACRVFVFAPKHRLVRASEFTMDMIGDPVVVKEAEIKWPAGRLRVAITETDARPPFEWQLEITSNIDETDYFKHYLVRDEDVVLAQRKILTPIDAEEAEVVLADLELALAQLENDRI